MSERGVQGRQVNMDLLRILACFSVVMLHSAAQFWYDYDITEGRWLVANTYDAAFRFGVPIFVMLSGRFFLGKDGELSLKTLYFKNILRLSVIYVVWNTVYGLWDCRYWMGAEGTVWKDYVREILYGRYHLWYLVMQIGLYMLLPVLKSWLEHCEKRNVEYFLLLFFIIQIGLNTIKILRIPGPVLQLLSQIDVELVCSYAGYFVLGYYLYRYPLRKKARCCLYAAGFMGLLGAAGVSVWESTIKGQKMSTAFDSYSLFTFLVTVALYVLFSSLQLSLEGRGSRLLQGLAKDTLGVYLMHLLLLEFLGDRSVYAHMENYVLGIPLLALGCFIVCVPVAALLRRIPLIGKYIC